MPVLASAAAPTGGTVSGTVTRADTAEPVDGVEVLLVSEVDFLTTQSGADGTFVLESVPDGEYRVRFVPPDGSDLASAFWRGAASWEDADTLTVAGGAAVRADIALPVGATISGTVTRASDGSPVPGVVAWLESEAGSATAETDADGRYTAVGLSPGSYTVEFAPPIIDDMPPELAYEYYRAVRAPSLATPVEVVAGADVVGIDAALEATGSISGRATRADTGDPVAGLTVSFTPEYFTSGFSTTTAADGSYTLAGVVPGRHFVGFHSDVDDLLDLYWPDAADHQDATLVTVESGRETSGIDASLPAAGIVSGHVRYGGRPWTAGGTVSIEAAAAPGTAQLHPLDEDGTFRVAKLVPGDYLIAVQPTADASRAASQYYPAAATREAAGPVRLDAGEHRDDIDFDLVTGVDITGRIAADGELSMPADIVAYRWSGTAWEEAGRTSSWDDYSFAEPPGDVSGHYLPPGRYTVGFAADGWCPQFWDGMPSLDDADAVDVAPGKVRAGVDATLTAECSAIIAPGAPAIDGEARVGATLIAQSGTWRPQTVELSYQWLIDGRELAGATDETLTVTEAMAGGRVSVAVTGARTGFAPVTATSPEVGPVVAVQRLPEAGGAPPWPAVVWAVALLAGGVLVLTSRRRRVSRP